MPLTGLQVFKLLPNTNCRECGYPTCLAFAMKLAAEKSRSRSVRMPLPMPAQPWAQPPRLRYAA